MKKESLFTCFVITAIIYLFFMWGALSVQLRIFPYSLLERSLIGISAIFYNKTERESLFLADGYNTPLFKEYIGKIGLTIEDKNNTDRYVLYSNSIDHIIRLINNDGQLIHEWNVHPTEKLQKPERCSRICKAVASNKKRTTREQRIILSKSRQSSELGVVRDY